MIYQSEETKRDEISVRKKMAEQEWIDPEPIWVMVESRMDETLKTLDRLEEDYGLGIGSRSVVGEFGAERCQRILAVTDWFGCQGHAFDLSPDALRSSVMVNERYFQGKVTLNLHAGDFLESSTKGFDGIFCFATLHHFPDPRPVFQKVYEMLVPGGWFYFDREPLKSFLGLHDIARYWRSKGGPITQGKILETQFSLKTWQEAFNHFERKDIWISFPPFGRRFKVNRFHQITGGRLSGILWKEGR